MLSFNIYDVKHIKLYNEKFMGLFNSPGDETIKEILKNKKDIQNVSESGYGYSFRFRDVFYKSEIEDILFARYYFYISNKEIECSHYLNKRLYDYLDKEAVKVPRPRR